LTSLDFLCMTSVRMHDLGSPLSCSMLLGLMNLCAQLKVSELVLLVPLLFRLRRPGADAGKGGPTVEEQNWSGLENVDFCRFREGIRSRPEKRT